MSSSAPQNRSSHHGANRFATTHWSVVLAASADDSQASRAALETLCEAYWYPLYAFVRRQGESPHDAEDVTQAFFSRLLESGDLQQVDPSRGRFRSFLLACLKHFLSNERDRARAQKRGGGKKIVSLDAAAAESRYLAEPADNKPPERFFERQWALTLLARTLDALRAAAEERGKLEQFDHLKIYLTGEHAGTTYAELAGKLDSSEEAVKQAVARLRAKYREQLRAEIADTVATSADVDDEIRDLFAALE